jgi:hypothetical protein
MNANPSGGFHDRQEAAMRRVVLVGVGLLFLAACGGSDSTSILGDDFDDPELSNLHVEQRRTGSGGTLTLTATVFDVDGDIFGGSVRSRHRFGAVTSQISDLGPGNARDSIGGTVSCSTPYSGHGVTVSGNLYVVDRGGNRSNRLSFTFVTERSASTIR